MGVASQAWIGASDGSLILACLREGRYEREFRRALPRDGHGDLRTEARPISAECAERLRHRPVDRDDHVHQQVPAVGRRRHLLDEQIVDAIVGMAIREREVECPLHLSAELTRLSLSLPT
jgi:hypothetical protein